MAEKRTVSLEIAGQRYRMSADTDPEHLERLAQRVNERIEALGTKAGRSASPTQLLAVVALGLAEDLEVAEQRCERVEAVTQRVVKEAIARIDRRLEQDAELAQRADEA